MTGSFTPRGAQWKWAWVTLTPSFTRRAYSPSVSCLLNLIVIVGASLGPSPHDSLARRGCGERADGALHTVARPIALLRGDPVVVGRPWLEVIETHAEPRVRMALVQPDGGLRGQAQVVGIRTVVNDAVMHV